MLTRPGSPLEMEERDIRGVRTRVWKNAPPTMREVFLLGRAHGAKTFLVYRDERASYEVFARAALATAEALQRAGVRKADRVAIAMRNLPEWSAAFFGTLLAGVSGLCSMPGGPGRNSNTASTIPAPRSPSSIASDLSGCSNICPTVRHEHIFVSRENEQGGASASYQAPIDHRRGKIPGICYRIGRGRTWRARSRARRAFTLRTRRESRRAPSARIGIRHVRSDQALFVGAKLPATRLTLKPGARASEQELRAFVAERLAAFKVPVRVCSHPGCCRAIRPAKS